MSNEHVVELDKHGVASLQGIQGLVVPDAEPRTRATAAPQTTIVPTDEPLSTDKLVAQLKARLKVVEREIKTRKSLESERDQIKRLLNAAKAKPAKVRDIRSVG